MTQIDQAEFMERMMGLLGRAASVVAPRQREGSLLTLPMAALNAPPRSFAEVYGMEGRLLARLAAQAVSDEPEMATLLTALEQGLQEGTLKVPVAAPPAPRLTAFVYPVI